MGENGSNKYGVGKLRRRELVGISMNQRTWGCLNQKKEARNLLLDK